MRSLTTRVTVVSIGVLLACLPLLSQTYNGRILGWLPTRPEPRWRALKWSLRICKEGFRVL